MLGKRFNITSLTVTILPAHTSTNKYGEQEAMPARRQEQLGCGAAAGRGAGAVAPAQAALADPRWRLCMAFPKPTQPRERAAEAGRDTLLFWIRRGLVFIPNWFKIN